MRLDVALREPDGGRSYPETLELAGEGPARGLIGALMALAAFFFAVPLVSQLVLVIGWLLQGRATGFTEYTTLASAYELPIGPLATQLALASLIPICLLLVRYLHGLRPHWLVSVQPGWRWRYLVLCLVAAAVILNGVVWVSNLWAPVEFGPPQPGWQWFALVIVLSSPLQAAAEEFFFRGYLLQTLGSAARNPWVGIVATAVLFALLHGVQNPALFANRLAFGLLAGWLVLVTGGLEAGIAAHVINNLSAYGYGLVTGGVAALKATTELTWAQAGTDIAGFALVAVAAWWLGRALRVATITPKP
ncbi:MAG: lysostaphin resistance A-like protein [Arachnia sp.]